MVDLKKEKKHEHISYAIWNFKYKFTNYDEDKTS